MNRTTFLIDGFNLYHSVKRASRDLSLNGAGTRWLDMRAFCAAYLHVIGGGAALQDVYLFSALAKHLEASNPDVTRRHKTYIECLKDTGVIVELGRFKSKTVVCTHCKQPMTRHEEKETDVAIAIKLLELCITDACDTAVIITGDTDIAPAIRAAQRLCPGKRIGVGFPYMRHNKELELLTNLAFDIKPQQYTKHQFPNPYTLANGRSINKPAHW